VAPLGAAVVNTRARFAITSPLAGATFLVDPTLRQDFQQLAFAAAGARGDVQWFVDDAPLAGNRWSLARGEHIVAAKDASGKSVRVRINVR
jgi:membrane carboxypeptidase/penicillin-binding protein PbpC